MAARVDGKEVVVSPDRFGAGVVNFTVANFSDSPITFTLSGPKEATTEEIPPGAPGDLKVELPEGDYEASAGEGAERPTGHGAGRAGAAQLQRRAPGAVGRDLAGRYSSPAGGASVTVSGRPVSSERAAARVASAER